MGEHSDRPDGALVHDTLSGSRDAFDELVARHAGLVYSVAYAEMLCTEDVEDVVQDTFMRAHSRLSRLQAADRFPAWLARIATSIARDRKRSAMRQARVRADWEDKSRVLLPDTNSTDIRELVERGLDALPEIYRRALVMRYLTEASYRDIASTLLISEVAARTRVRRALELLRKAFRRLGIEEDCRATLRTHCLALPALGPIITAAQARAHAMPAPGTDARIPLPAWIASAVTTGGVALTLLMGAALDRSSRVESALSPGAGGERSVRAVEAVLHRPVVPIRARVPQSLYRQVLVADDQLTGWQPANPSADSALPARAGSALPGRPNAGVLSNDYGVYRTFEPTTGSVLVEVWLQPSDRNPEVALGLVYGPRMDDWVRIIKCDATGRWAYRVGYEDVWLPDMRATGIAVAIEYDTTTAAYDLRIDGAQVIERVPLPAPFAGRPVEGVHLRSGRQLRGEPTYFDDLRVAAGPAGTRKWRDVVRTSGAVNPLPWAPILTLESGTVNGRQIGATNAVVTARPGERIAGSLHVRLENPHPPRAIFPVIAVPTWGRRETSYYTVVGDAPTGVSRHDVPIGLTAPPTPGVYHLIVVGIAETTPAHVASATSWAAGAPVWNNETDVSGWPQEMIDLAMRHGGLHPPWLNGRRQRSRTSAGATAIRIQVTDPRT